MKTKKSFSEIYSFPGFRARSTFKKGILGDPKARIVHLERRQKKRYVRHAARHPKAITTNVPIEFEISPVGTCGFIWNSNTAESIARIARL